MQRAYGILRPPPAPSRSSSCRRRLAVQAVAHVAAAAGGPVQLGGDGGNGRGVCLGGSGARPSSTGPVAVAAAGVGEAGVQCEERGVGGAGAQCEGRGMLPPLLAAPPAGAAAGAASAATQDKECDWTRYPPAAAATCATGSVSLGEGHVVRPPLASPARGPSCGCDTRCRSG